MEADLWPLFGGRDQYRSAPTLKVHKHILRWQVQKECEAEQRKKENDQWHDLQGQMGVDTD